MRFYRPLAAIALSSSQRNLIRTDVAKWMTNLDLGISPGVDNASERDAVAALLSKEPAFRNLLYYRLSHGPSARMQVLVPLFRRVWRPLHSLRLWPDSLGPGCFILHGWGTSVVAKSIGSNFVVGPNVGIGYTGAGKYPTVGDNVSILIGAIVIGDISIGDDVVIGAGAVVARDVPDGVTMVGLPARPCALTRTPGP